MALQTTISLKRSHANFWTSLSSAYKDLESARRSRLRLRALCSCDGGGRGVERGCEHKDGSTDGGTSAGKGLLRSGSGACSVCLMQEILLKTVQLFRPYFSWRVNSEVDDASQAQNPANIEEDNIELQEEEQHMHHQGPCTKLGTCSEEQSNVADFSCTKSCPFFKISQCRGGTSSSDYVSTMLRSSSTVVCSGSRGRHESIPDCENPPSLLHASPPPCSGPKLCLDHSLFTVLVRGIVSPTDAAAMMERLQGQSPPFLDVLESLLSQFSAMAACSCLLWAR